MNRFIFHEFSKSILYKLFIGTILLLVILWSLWGVYIPGADNHYMLLGLPLVSNPGISWRNLLSTILLLEAMVLLVKPFVDVMENKRLRIILSYPISRSQLLNSYIFTGIICNFIYIFLPLFMIHAVFYYQGVIPGEQIYQYPLKAFFEVSSVVMLGMFLILMFNSYTISTLGLIIYYTFLAPLLLGYEFFISGAPMLLKNGIAALSYVMPRVQEFSSVVNIGGGINYQLFIGIAASYLPIFVLSHYIFGRKDI